jgi:ABC-2 type transport system permease protein
MTAVAGTRQEGRPSATQLVWRQLRHANRGFWRTPIAAFFTLVFPLLFLLLIGAIAGNAVLDPATGLRLAQFLTPSMAVFGTAIAAFTTLAIAVAEEREQGLLKRLRSTPLPAWAYVTGRVLSAAWTALLSVGILVAVGVALYGVEIVWSKLPAAVLTLLVALASLSALGLALAALVGRSETVGVVANGVLIPLAFVSGVFLAGDLPAWLERVAAVFPLRHFVEALTETFNPYTPGAGFRWGNLAVLLAWGGAGAVVAVRFFRWEAPTGPRRPRGRPAPATVEGAARDPGDAPPVGRVEHAGRPRLAALLGAQLGHAVTAVFRERATVAFTVLFPVVLVLLLPQVFGRGTLPDRGVPLAQFMTPVLAVYGLAAAAYADLGQRMAQARERGVLKRVHGSPLPLWTYVAGRTGGAIAVGLLTLVACVVAGVLVYDVEVLWARVPALLVYVVLGLACLAALGLAVSTLARDARSASTIANATLLPLAFASDIFLVGDLPGWLDAIGWAFPLKPLANGVAATFNPTVAGVGWHAGYLLSLGVWTVVGVALAARYFRWQPPEPRARRRTRR